MKMQRVAYVFLLSLSLAGISAAQDARFLRYYGPKFGPGIRIDRGLTPPLDYDAVHRWNLIAINATGLDHTPVEPGDVRVFGEQLGPCRASRAMAIVHMAIFDCLNAVAGDHHGFTGELNPPDPVSADAAIAQSAHDTLAALFPSQAPSFDALLVEDLVAISDAVARANGVSLGQDVAAAILAERLNDGSEIPDPVVDTGWITSDQPGHWRQDPVSLIPLALGAHWGECRPFFLQTTAQFRCPAPPPMDTAEYTSAYYEAKNLGGDGVITPTLRTPLQTFIGTFWAYDGTPSLCAPPRMYNQILVAIADQTGLTSLQTARLLALANVAMADEAMTCWESKYHWDFWRPVHGIRESDVGTGPSGLGDGNPNTVGDVNFMPLGAPASNLTGPNFTPPFPTYPSGHASFGGALFQVLRRFYGTDNVPFTFLSDEYNGTTRAADGMVRPFLPRHFNSFSAAEEENGQSRIYLGIHWKFDKTSAIAQGRRVGDYIYDHALQNGTPAKMANISTRLRVETGDNVPIAGFIVKGNASKRVIVRAIGPSLNVSGAPVPGRVSDTTLELVGPGGTIMTNDNWRIGGQEADIIASMVQPPNDLESAIIATLPASTDGIAYTAVMRGKNGATGVGQVEVYDLDGSADSELGNVSSRGLVQTGDDVMIGGIILRGDAPRRVVVRAIGPSLSVMGTPLPDRLLDTTLEVRDANGALEAENDNWRSDEEINIIATTLPPSDDRESVIVATLPASMGGTSHTAIVRGKNGTTGVALVEAFAMP